MPSILYVPLEPTKKKYSYEASKWSSLYVQVGGSDVGAVVNK